MSLSIPLNGISAASEALDLAAKGLSKIFGHGSKSSATSTSASSPDSASLSTSAVNLLNAKNDFSANLKSASIENQMAQSTFSILG